ncbi:MAG: hypothetical protein QXH81_03410 [Thermofilaceae archaeon]
MQEIEEKKRVVEEILKWYVEEYARRANAGEETRDLDYELELKLSGHLDEVVWEVEASSMDYGSYFCVTTCGFHVGSIIRPPKVYDVIAIIRFVTVEGRHSAYLEQVSIDERTLIDNERTPFAAALTDAINWWRVRPTWMQKIVDTIERIAEAEWNGKLTKTLGEIVEEVKEAQWIYEFRQFYDALLETAEKFGIRLS